MLVGLVCRPRTFSPPLTNRPSDCSAFLLRTNPPERSSSPVSLQERQEYPSDAVSSIRQVSESLVHQSELFQNQPHPLLPFPPSIEAHLSIFPPSLFSLRSDLLIKILPSSSTSFLSPLSLRPPLSHPKPPRALAWSPDGEILLSTGCEGNLIVWDARESVLKEGQEEEDSKWEEPKVLKIFEGLVKSGEPE